MKHKGVLISLLFMLFLTTLIPATVNAQKPPEKYLQEMVDSVNYLLMTCPDRSMQCELSVSLNGNASLLDNKKSGFRFNLFKLKRGTVNDNDAGIEFIPEMIGSKTTNKWITFNTVEDNRVANIKFTATDEEMVKRIHAMLLRIRAYVFEMAR